MKAGDPVPPRPDPLAIWLEAELKLQFMPSSLGEFKIPALAGIKPPGMNFRCKANEGMAMMQSKHPSIASSI